jgi:PAS domain S-box-containing protein
VPVKARPLLHLFVGAVGVAAVTSSVLVALLDGGISRRWWLLPIVGGLLVCEHLVETGVVHGREQRERIGLQEGYLVALALLTRPLGAVIVFAAALAAGNLLARREPIKALFNVASMTFGAALALLVVAAVEQATGSVPLLASAAVAAGAIFFAVNRLLIATVLTLAGTGTPVLAHLRADLGPLALVAAADVSIGVLAGLAGITELWALPFALVAIVVLHVALSGHAHARAEQQKLQDLVGSTSDGIITLDRDGRITSWNDAGTQITGHARERILGLSLRELGELLDAPRDAFEGEERRPPVETVAIQTADGETRWLAISRSPLPEWGWVIVFRDETARRQMEELRALHETERLKSDLIAAVSHELRTPLTSIVGFAETLLRHDPPPGEQRRFLEITYQQALRLGRLVDDLLDLRALSEGPARLELETVDIVALLREQADVFAATSELHEIELDAPEPPLYVDIDAFRMRQVVSNLVANAIKYSPDGGRVQLRAATTPGSVRIEVVDQGIGIPPAVQPRVFEPFFRGEDPSRRMIGGVGLGLALSREIVEAHGGSIGFESRELAGSTFFVELPAATVPAPAGGKWRGVRYREARSRRGCSR